MIDFLPKGHKPQDYISVKGALMQNNKEPLAKSFPTYDGNDKTVFEDNEYDQKFEHLMKSGPLGTCNNPYCTTCPPHWSYKAAPRKPWRTTDIFDPKFHNTLYGDAKGWARRLCSFLISWLPGVVNPHSKVFQQWNQFFVISCLVSIFVDPLFFFLLYVRQDDKCIVLDWTMTRTIVVFRSITDFIYLLHILLQFRLAYVAPESRVVGAGDWVDHPKKIAFRYLKGYFLIDMFAVLPIPQIIILCVLPKTVSLSGANYAKNLLRAAVLFQYIPRLYRFLPLVVGQSPNGFIFESAWANFMMNLLTFVLAGHVVGSCWYLFGLQRVNQCLRDACQGSGIPQCITFTDCGSGRTFNSVAGWSDWKNNANATACFNTGSGDFAYGIYVQAVGLTAERSVIKRYVYSFFWGFQQISTLAGNQVPSYFIWEVLFTMGIIGLGLLLFALLIGNMQNFLQSLGRRRLEMTLRRRDVELWMNHRRLPEELRRKVRESERYSWAATRGVNEAMLMDDLPEDLQREIRRHLFKFVAKVRVFTLMKETVLDAICERLKQKMYIKGSIILNSGCLIDKIVFIVRGKMESKGEDGLRFLLSEGDVCGEELLISPIEHSAQNQVEEEKYHGPRIISNRVVACCTNVEAFILKYDDLAEVTRLFATDLDHVRVRGAARYVSPYYRCLATVTIQAAWKQHRMRRLKLLSSRDSRSL
ncbi:Probable cyclic nucleotide-gated ion channel 20, chloroplastic [Dionaea muscipula]